MSKRLKEELLNLGRLFRFIIGYAIIALVIFNILPAMAGIAENSYEALSSSVRFFIVLGFFLVIAVWQVLDSRDRKRKQMIDSPD